MNKKQFLSDFMRDVWNNKEFEKVEKYINKEYEIKLDPADPWEGKILDHEEFKKRLRYSFDSFSDLNFEITNQIEDINHVAISWIMRGTNDGQIENIPPTYKKIQTTGITIYHFKKSKICGHSQVFDRSIVMSQLAFFGV